MRVVPSTYLSNLTIDSYMDKLALFVCIDRSAHFFSISNAPLSHVCGRDNKVLL